MESVDWIKAGIAGLAVLAVYLVSIFGKPKQAPLPRSFALWVLIAVVGVHLLAAAILPTRPDLTRAMTFVETNLGRKDLVIHLVRSIEIKLRRAGASEAASGSELALALRDIANAEEVLAAQERALKAQGRELAARSSRVSPMHRDMFKE